MQSNPETTPPPVKLSQSEYENLLETIKRQEKEIAALEFRIKTLIEGQ